MEYVEFLLKLLSRFWLLWCGVGVLALVGIADSYYTQKRRRHQQILKNRKEFSERYNR